MNLLMATGYLGSNCEVRTLPTGTVVCTFPIALNQWSEGEKTTTWVQCDLWGKRAQGELPKYLTKGTKVFVSGEFIVKYYKDTQGNNKHSFSCNVNQLELLGGTSQDGGNTSQAQRQYQNQPTNRQQQPSGQHTQHSPTQHEDPLPF